MSKTIANLILNDLKGLLKKHKIKIEECPLAPEVVGFLGRCIDDGLLGKKEARAFLVKWLEEKL